jgi:hypothetical protein
MRLIKIMSIYREGVETYETPFISNFDSTGMLYYTPERNINDAVLVDNDHYLNYEI